MRWTVTAAAVLVYIELGPGGEVLGTLVASIVQVLMGIDWAGLGEQIVTQIDVLAEAIVEAAESAIQTVRR